MKTNNKIKLKLKNTNNTKKIINKTKEILDCDKQTTDFKKFYSLFPIGDIYINNPQGDCVLIAYLRELYYSPLKKYLLAYRSVQKYNQQTINETYYILNVLHYMEKIDLSDNNIKKQNIYQQQMQNAFFKLKGYLLRDLKEIDKNNTIEKNKVYRQTMQKILNIEDNKFRRFDVDLNLDKKDIKNNVRQIISNNGFSCNQQIVLTYTPNEPLITKHLYDILDAYDNELKSQNKKLTSAYIILNKNNNEAGHATLFGLTQLNNGMLTNDYYQQEQNELNKFCTVTLRLNFADIPNYLVEYNKPSVKSGKNTLLNTDYGKLIEEYEAKQQAIEAKTKQHQIANITNSFTTKKKLQNIKTNIQNQMLTNKKQTLLKTLYQAQPSKTRHRNNGQQIKNTKIIIDAGKQPT